MKPREFWIAPYEDEPEDELDILFGDALLSHPRQGPNQHLIIHVREVIDISEQEIRNLAFDYDIANEHKDIEKAFEAGARWAIAKLRGGE